MTEHLLIPYHVPDTVLPRRPTPTFYRAIAQWKSKFLPPLLMSFLVDEVLLHTPCDLITITHLGSSCKDWGSHHYITDEDTESQRNEKSLGYGLIIRACQGRTRGCSDFSWSSFFCTFALQSRIHRTAVAEACGNVSKADLRHHPGSSQSEPAF